MKSKTTDILLDHLIITPENDFLYGVSGGTPDLRNDFESHNYPSNIYLKDTSKRINAITGARMVAMIAEIRTAALEASFFVMSLIMSQEMP